MQIVAGSDTTAGVVRAALLFIATTPRVYYRLQKEIDEGVANGKISTPVTYGESKNLSYLTVRFSRLGD
jgi:cytochrome P450